MYSDGSDSIVNSLYWRNYVEPEVFDVWLHYMHPEAIVLDIGANTGFYSLLTAHLAPQARVFAFEPVPRVLQFLEKNIELNKLAHQIQICPEVVSNQIGSTEFYVVDSLTLPLGSSQNEAFRSRDYRTQKISVPMNTVDHFLGAFELPHLDLIKIDTESTEHLVCEGMLQTIEKYRPAIICEILSDFVGESVQKLLEPFDYEYFFITHDGLEATDKMKRKPGSDNLLLKPKIKTND